MKVVASGVKWEKMSEVFFECLWENISTPSMKKDD
jgi:hypothetical protein